MQRHRTKNRSAKNRRMQLCCMFNNAGRGLPSRHYFYRFFALQEKSDGAPSPNLARFLPVVQNPFRDVCIVRRTTNLIVQPTSNNEPQTTCHPFRDSFLNTTTNYKYYCYTVIFA